MSLQGKSLLAGRTGAPGGATFRAFNPTTNQVLSPDFHEASPAEADGAMDAAAAAFPDYRARPPETRARLLDAIAAEIEKLGDELLDRAHAETGLPAARLQGERARTCGQLRLFAQVVREGSWVDARIDTALPARQPLPRPDIRRMLIPLGPVVVFGSSNFPLAFSVAGGDTASALAVGCPVVVKAHRAHPGTAELVGQAVVRAVAECGLPPGVFSLIHGSGAGIGVAMVKHPAATAVGFTGSHAAGRALCDVAAARTHPIPVFAEMSSLNPVILLPAALRERGAAIAQGLLASFTLGSGQFCTKPGLVFALRGLDADGFLASLTDGVQRTPCATMLTPGILGNFLENRQVVMSAPGVALLTESPATIEKAGTQSRPGVALTTTSNFLAQPAIAREAFGPFTVVIQGENLDEIMTAVATLEGQLTATVHGTDADLEQAKPLLDVLAQKAGRLIINGFPTGVEVCAAMNHGGPSPATSDARFTSVGTAAMLRFARPICYQNFPDALLPVELQRGNERRIMRLIDGKQTRDAG